MNNQQQRHSQFQGFAQPPVSFFAGSYPQSQPTQPAVYPNSLSHHLQQQQHQQQQKQQNFHTLPHQDLQEQQQRSHFYQSLPQATPTQSSRQSHLSRQHSQPTQQQRSQNQNGFAQSEQFRPTPSQPQTIPPSPGSGPGAPPPQSSSPPQEDSHLMSSFAQDGDGYNQDSEMVDQENNMDEEDEDDDDQDDADHNLDEPIYQLPAPPEAIYPDEIELEKALHAWSLEHGYELVRRASKKNAKGLLYKRYFHCSKHGKVPPSKRVTEKNRIRVNRKSNRIGCPMSLAAVAVNPSDPSGDWQIRHRKSYHNHPAVEAINLAGHRRRARRGGVERAVDGLFKINTSNTDVLKFLQSTHPEGLFNRVDVANMKLKYNAHGTCASTRGIPGAPAPAPQESSHDGSHKPGLPTACFNCRAKKRKCNSARPSCDNCTKNNVRCIYDSNAIARTSQPSTSDSTQPAQVTQNNAQGRTSDPPRQLSQRPIPPAGDESSSTGMRNGADAAGFAIPPTPNLRNNDMDTRQALEALTALTNFQQEHVKQVKLSLESSQVESLASSTCGYGECYKSVMPRPFTLGSDWRLFKDNFYAAAVRENSNEVLTGSKKEPDTPQGELSVEEHNEYIKQLAIFKRRNEMLKIGIKECLHPTLWARVRSMPYAADMWRMLEDICMPRGSDGAYVRFAELLNVHLCQSNNLDTYIFHLETKYTEYNQEAACHESRRAIGMNPSNLEKAKRIGGGDGSFPEELLCFLFLQNLGSLHQSLAKNLTKKANIGGFGTGERVTFKQLTTLVKNHFAWEASRGGSQ